MIFYTARKPLVILVEGLHNRDDTLSGLGCILIAIWDGSSEGYRVRLLGFYVSNHILLHIIPNKFTQDLIPGISFRSKCLL